MKLAIVGRMAPSTGSRNIPRCTMSRLLPESDTCLSVNLRTVESFFSLRVLKPNHFELRSTHSLIRSQDTC